MAWAQNETLREDSRASIPTRDLNHWRSSSTRLIRATGTPQICEAISVRSSNACSGSVSRILYWRRAFSRPASSATAMSSSDGHQPEPCRASYSHEIYTNLQGVGARDSECTPPVCKLRLPCHYLSKKASCHQETRG